MELSERSIQILEKEGFTYVSEWSDPAGTVYDAHVHHGPVAVFVTEGAITFQLATGPQTVRAGERIDIGPDIPHSATVGPNGWQCVVGAMHESDT